MRSIMKTEKLALILMILAASALHAQQTTSTAQAGQVRVQCPKYVCPTVPAEQWKHSLATYLWIPAQNGNAIIRGRPVDVDISISDTLDSLSDLDGAFTSHYEASRGRWTILADLLYTRLRSDVSTALGPFEYEPTQVIAELGATYLIDKKSLGYEKYSTTEVLGGFRYNKFALRLIGPLGNLDAKGEQSWVDPFIGARFRRNLTDRWTLSFRGDIGGFGIGEASHFTWNVVILAEYKLSGLWNAGLGWRFLDYNYDTGSGADRFEYDVLMQGPFTGISYNF
jgi:hypothetical protein